MSIGNNADWRRLVRESDKHGQEDQRMSISPHHYVGPIAIVEMPSHPRTVTRPECPAGHRFPLASPKFCPTCGAQIRDVQVATTDRDQTYDLIGDRALTNTSTDDDGREFLIPNGPKRPREFWIDSDEEQFSELSSLNPGVEIAWFELTFAAEIEKLRTAGAKVRVAWGIRTWFM